MTGPSAPQRKISPVLQIAGVFVVVAALMTGFYLSRPAPHTTAAAPTPDANSYLPQLALSSVEMKAAENVMRQQVVYVTGQITNHGPRLVNRIDVYCIFSDVNGREVHRERATVIGPNLSLPSQNTRSFRMAFDSVPDSWNQALPQLVIAQIRFG